jgi:hypothetical protein
MFGVTSQIVAVSNRPDALRVLLTEAATASIRDGTHMDRGTAT